MAKLSLKSNYAVETKYGAYFTGKRVQVANDGSSLLCECEDSVGIVTLATGQVTGRIPCNDDVITCISLAPDNSSVIVALRSTSVQQYQWPSLELQRSFRSYHRGPVMVMGWDASSTLLITGAADSSARIWDLQQKFCTHSLKGASGVFGSVLFDPDLSQRPHVYGAAGSTIHIWALAAGSSTLVTSLQGHHSSVTSLQITSDNTHLVSCGLDRVIILWDLKTFDNKRVVPVLESLSGIILQPKDSIFPGGQLDDGHIYALGVGDKGFPAVWQVDTGRQVWKASAPLLTTPNQEGASLINQLVFSPVLDSIIFTTYDHSILFAKTNTLDVWKQLSGYNDQILDVVFAGSGDTHLVMATNSVQLRIYDTSNFSCHLIQGHTANVYSLCRHPTQHSLFASSSHDNTARVWHLKDDGTAVCIAIAVGHTLSVGVVVLSQGFMVTGSNDMCLKRWNIEKLLKDPTDGSVVSLSSTHTEKAHDKDINSICVSVNYKLIASGSQDKTAKVWDSTNLSLMGVLRGHRRGIWCVQFSPVDEVLATASGDGTIKIWTLTDFTNASTLEGHGVSVMKLSWISQGQQLLSIGSDGLLKLWTVKTRQCIQTYDEHDDRLWALAVSSDEMKLVTGGEDATLIQWKDVTQEEKDKETEEAARIAAEEQTLSNLIQDKKWAKALGIAIRLNQPYRGLKIIKELLDEGTDQLPEILRKLRHDQLVTILQFASEWNTKTKNSREAQKVLGIVLSSQTPEDLEAMKEWQQLLEGFIPYTDRHFRRLSALCQSSSILNYMSSSLSLGENANSIAVPEAQSDLELLQTIYDYPVVGNEGDGSNDKEDESNNGYLTDDDDEGSEDEEEEVCASIKAAIRDSVMVRNESDESSEGEEESDDEEFDSEMDVSECNEREEKLEDSGISEELTIPAKSVDDLDANFIIERVVPGSSDDDGEIEDDGNQIEKSVKVRSFSSDQIVFESKKEKIHKGGKHKKNLRTKSNRRRN